MIEFLCLQCCDCGTFQCQQKRKDSKFSCKVCGKKQSVIKVYGISYKAKDIRGLVMKYNEMRGRDELVEQEQVLASNETTEDYSQEGNTSSLNDGAPARPETSKWAQFMEDDKSTGGQRDEDDDDDDDDVVQAFLLKRQKLQEKRERRRPTPYQKRPPREAPQPISSVHVPQARPSLPRETVASVVPPKSYKEMNKKNDGSDDDEEETGSKKIVVDPNSKWAAFL